MYKAILVFIIQNKQNICGHGVFVLVKFRSMALFITRRVDIYGGVVYVSFTY
jgi:hypothetical protein